MERVAERFLQFVRFNTQSRYDADCYPSTEWQWIFARFLAEECKKIGLDEVRLDTYGYVTATLPANTDKIDRVIGFIAHMDTSPEASGENVKPCVIENYDGQEILLSSSLNMILSPEEFPDLKTLKGHDLIVTDGTTLLGADDKSGIAEILTAMEYLLAHPEVKHGKIRIAFTPDEEIGKGAEHFDVAAFGADFAYTVDGSGLGELEFESFNGARARFCITGRSVHPGYAKDIMVSAALIAHEIIGAFPAAETPAHTEGYEGYFHLTDVSGNVEEAHLSYIIRDFDRKKFDDRKKFVEDLAHSMRKKYGERNIVLNLYDEYRNMIEVLEDKKEIINLAKAAMEEAGIRPLIKSVRGGTDGSRLSFMGLPCPNIFTGGRNFHGPYEYVSVNEMTCAVKVIVNICRSYK